MFIQEIIIPQKHIKLISPRPEHAAISLEWVSGIKGRKLLEKMGNNIPDNWTPTIKEEKQRISDFITKDDQINWAIQYEGKVVGAVWLDLREDHLLGPHIMIGDESVYGRGIATSVLSAVCDWALKEKKGNLARFNFKRLTTRCRVDNAPMIHVNEKLGFKPVGQQYLEDAIEWQNYQITE